MKTNFMAGICWGIESESATTASSAAAAATVVSEPSSSKRTRFELRKLKLVAPAQVSVPFVQLNDDRSTKRRKLDLLPVLSNNHPTFDPKEVSSVENPKPKEEAKEIVQVEEPQREPPTRVVETEPKPEPETECLKFGMTSVCGRRRDMEDAVSIRTSFVNGNISFFGVFDGHGCSHVAMRCRERMHEIVREEIGRRMEWKETMENSFVRMDREVDAWSSGAAGGGSESYCKCEHQILQSDAIGSTAVVAVVTTDKIVVSNCGDSRAILCRNGVAVPLSSDHKPDRPDELLRIEAAGGRVIYWDVPRVLGMLAMSRAIGDNYLKPYVIPNPEVTVMDRTDEDECLILASDGLWDVVPNEVACGVARMCLQAQKPPSPPVSPASEAAVGSGAVESSDKACCDASILLTKLALARHSMDNVSVVVVDLRRNQNVDQDSNKKQ